MENNEWFNKFKGRFCRDEKKIFIYDDEWFAKSWITNVINKLGNFSYRQVAESATNIACD